MLFIIVPSLSAMSSLLSMVMAAKKRRRQDSDDIQPVKKAQNRKQCNQGELEGVEGIGPKQCNQGELEGVEGSRPKQRKGKQPRKLNDQVESHLQPTAEKQAQVAGSNALAGDGDCTGRDDDTITDANCEGGSVPSRSPLFLPSNQACSSCRPCFTKM
jgi:hypothetical protein